MTSKTLTPYIIILLALNAQVGFTETVYKGVDANGNPIFSDQPLPGGEKINIQPAQTYTPVPVPQNNDTNASTQPQEIHYEVSITQPQNDETITTDVVSIPVVLSVTPALQQGDKIRLLLNGQPYGALTDSLSITLGRLDRGTYIVKAEVVAEADPTKIKGESNSVTFYQKRTSIGRNNVLP